MKRLLLLTVWWLLLLPGGKVFAADVVTLRDGRTVSGLVESGANGEIRIKVGDNSQALPKDQIQSIRFDHSLTLPVGTDIAIRTIDAIDSDTATTSHEYAASLDDPVLIGGAEAVPANAKAVLRVTDVTKPSGLKKIGGRATMSMALVAVFINGQRVEVKTDEVDSKSGTHAKRTAIGAGAGAAGGAAIGAGAGGAVGAGIGAGIGAVAGALGGGLTGKSTVKIASETRFTYKLTQPVECKDQAAPALPDSPSTDTLTLPDGTSVAGNWVGIDAGKISFQANDQAATYPEAQVSAVTFSAPPPPPIAPPPPPADTTQHVALGQSVEEVVAILGKPVSIGEIGSRKIYFYDTVKVTFVDGKVTDIK
jgi:uncharacterized protein YcfJ